VSDKQYIGPGEDAKLSSL